MQRSSKSMTQCSCLQGFSKQWKLNYEKKNTEIRPILGQNTSWFSKYEAIFETEQTQ